MKKVITLFILVFMLVSSIAIISCGGGTTAETKSEPEKPATESSSEKPATMLHSLEGRSNCLICHDEGKVQPFPADHAGKENDSCLTCHKQ